VLRKSKKQKKPRKWKLKKDKVIGYVLLLVGLILIAFAIYSVYDSYTSGSAPISLTIIGENISIQGENETMIIEGISGEGVNRMAGLGLWWMAMFFVMIGGGKIAGMGVKMIREIKVEVKIKE
jgi:amino acid transporter